MKIWNLFSLLFQLFAQRCLQAGISEMYCNIEAQEGGKVDSFLKELEDGGVRLQEGERYIKAYPSDQLRMEKSWETYVE